MAKSKWKPGAPPGEGEYWIFWRTEFGWKVSLANIGPAVLIPNGRLLLKLSGGVCFGYDDNVERITHHIPVTTPSPPPGTKETYEIPYDPEFPGNADV